MHEVGRGEAQAGQQPGVEAGVALQLDTWQQGDEMIEDKSGAMLSC